MDNTNVFSHETSKKEARKIVYNKLVDALGEFRPFLKKKKFDNKMLTATKLFADDIVKSTRKSRAKRKKEKKETNQKNGLVTDLVYSD